MRVEPEPEPAVTRVEGVFCNQCGWKNPLGARFCSRCGSALQEVATLGFANEPDVLPQVMPAPQAVRRPSNGEADNTAKALPRIDFRKMSIVVTIGAILLVLVLYGVTVVSKQSPIGGSTQMRAQEPTESVAAANVPAVPPELAARAEALRLAADSLEGAARAARLAELVNLYLVSGFLPQAAEAQAEVAGEIGTAQAWADAGNLNYQAMQQAEGSAKMAYANEAIAAYSKSLEIDPANPDVRTDMATAYLATNNPMEGVQQITQVLDDYPDHVQANFNYGVMLSMIGRTDQSIAQFERVLELVEPGTDTYQQAELALRELRR